MEIPIHPFNAQLRTNPLRSKKEVTTALVQILEPPMQLCLSSGRFGRLHMSDSGAFYTEERNQLFVEMGAVVAFLYETRSDFWNTLGKKDQTHSNPADQSWPVRVHLALSG